MYREARTAGQLELTRPNRSRIPCGGKMETTGGVLLPSRAKPDSDAFQLQRCFPPDRPPSSKGSSPVHMLKYLSMFLTAIGVLMAGAAWLLDLDQVFILGGVLLAWAGVVKIAVVAIWTRVALMGTDDHRPVSGT